MRSIKTIGLAIVAVLAVGAVMVATASAGEFKHFKASKTGTLKGHALNTQKFKTGSGATVECTKLSASGSVTALETTEQKINVKYENCSVLVFGTASVSEARYTFFTPLEVSVLEVAIIIKASGLGEECEIEVKNPQTLGTGLAKSGKMEVEYVNKSGKIEDKNEVEKIKSKILKSTSSTNCGTAGSEVSTGTYTGNAEIELEGGTIEATEA